MSDDERTQKLNNKNQEELQPLLEFNAFASISWIVIAQFIIILLMLIFGCIVLYVKVSIWIIISIIFFAGNFLFRYVLPNKNKYIFTKDGIEIYHNNICYCKREWTYFKYYSIDESNIYLSPTIFDNKQESSFGIVTIPFKEEHKIEMLELIKYYIPLHNKEFILKS